MLIISNYCGQISILPTKIDSLQFDIFADFQWCFPEGQQGHHEHVATC
jgi:hypothetical protein